MCNDWNVGATHVMTHLLNKECLHVRDDRTLHGGSSTAIALSVQTHSLLIGKFYGF